MTSLANTCEGTAGTAVSTTNSVGPDQFSNAGASGTGTTLNYSSTHPAFEATGIQGHLATVASTAYVAWTFTASGSAYARQYVYLTANPSVQPRIGAFFNGGSICAGFLITATGLLRISNSSNGTAATSTGTVPLNTLVRIEFELTGMSGTTGNAAMRCYSGSNLNGTTPDTNCSITASGMTTGAATCDSVRYGAACISATQTTAWDFWFDQIAFSDAAQPGPFIIALSDTGSGDDSGFFVAAAVPLGDPGTGVDAASVAATVPLTDAGSGADTLGAADANQKAPLPFPPFAAPFVEPNAVPLQMLGSTAQSASVALTDSAAGDDSGFVVAATAAPADTASGDDEITVVQSTDQSQSASPLPFPPFAAPFIEPAPVPLQLLGEASTPVPLLFPDDPAAAGVDAVAVAAAVPLTEDFAGVDSAAVAATLALSDAFIGDPADEGRVVTVTISVAAAVPLGDPGTGADQVTVAAAVTSGDDPGTGVDAVAVAAAVPLAEVGAAADTVTVTVPVALADTGSGTDAVTLTVTAPLTDTGSAADAATVAAAVPLGDDPGTGADQVTVGDTDANQAPPLPFPPFAAPFIEPNAVPLQMCGDQTSTPLIALTDAGAGTDTVAAMVAATLPDDPGTGVETLGVVATATVADTGSSADGAAAAVLVPLPDAGGGADAVTAVAAAVPLADTAAGTDSAAAAVTGAAAADSAAGVDGITGVAVQASLVDVAAAVEAFSVQVLASLTDGGAGVDTVAMQAAVLIAETAAFLEHVTATTTVPLADAAAGVDAFVLLGPALERLYSVPGEVRVYGVPVDDRFLSVPGEGRTYSAEGGRS